MKKAETIYLIKYVFVCGQTKSYLVRNVVIIISAWNLEGFYFHGMGWTLLLWAVWAVALFLKSITVFLKTHIRPTIRSSHLQAQLRPNVCNLLSIYNNRIIYLWLGTKVYR